MDTSGDDQISSCNTRPATQAETGPPWDYEARLINVATMDHLKERLNETQTGKEFYQKIIDSRSGSLAGHAINEFMKEVESTVELVLKIPVERLLDETRIKFKISEVITEESMKSLYPKEFFVGEDIGKPEGYILSMVCVGHKQDSKYDLAFGHEILTSVLSFINNAMPGRVNAEAVKQVIIHQGCSSVRIPGVCDDDASNELAALEKTLLNTGEYLSNSIPQSVLHEVQLLRDQIRMYAEVTSASIDRTCTAVPKGIVLRKKHEKDRKLADVVTPEDSLIGNVLKMLGTVRFVLQGKLDDTPQSQAESNILVVPGDVYDNAKWELVRRAELVKKHLCAYFPDTNAWIELTNLKRIQELKKECTTGFINVALLFKMKMCYFPALVKGPTAMAYMRGIGCGMYPQPLWSSESVVQKKGTLRSPKEEPVKHSTAWDVREHHQEQLAIIRKRREKAEAEKNYTSSKRSLDCDEKKNSMACSDLGELPACAVPQQIDSDEMDCN